MVAGYDQDVAVAVARAGPGFLERLQPVEGLLDGVQCARVGEVAGVDE